MSSTSSVCNLILYNYTKVGDIIIVINCSTKNQFLMHTHVYERERNIVFS